MLKVRLIPVMTFNGISLVKTKQFANARTVGNPIQVARVYNNRNVDELVFIDIRATEQGRKINLPLVKKVIDETVASLSVGFGKIGLPLRLALTGTVNSPSIDLVCSILGKEVTLRRLNSFLNRIKN